MYVVSFPLFAVSSDKSVMLRFPISRVLYIPGNIGKRQTETRLRWPAPDTLLFLLLLLLAFSPAYTEPVGARSHVSKWRTTVTNETPYMLFLKVRVEVLNSAGGGVSASKRWLRSLCGTACIHWDIYVLYALFFTLSFFLLLLSRQVVVTLPSLHLLIRSRVEGTLQTGVGGGARLGMGYVGLEWPGGAAGG